LSPATRFSLFLFPAAAAKGLVNPDNFIKEEVIQITT